MADIKLLAPILLKWEGGYQSDKDDNGNYNSKKELVGTKYGVSALAYEKQFKKIPSALDMKNLSYEDASFVLSSYWNACNADRINNQSIANIIVDWYYNSGKLGIIESQKAIGVSADGVIGENTILKINSSNSKELFDKLKASRLSFIERIVKNNPKKAKFKNGWINRINDFDFK